MFGKNNERLVIACSHPLIHQPLAVIKINISVLKKQ